MPYFKATRSDAKSFHAGPGGRHVLYAVGATVTIPKARQRAELCADGVLHASDVAAETLIGGSWPCRLFEVSGEPVCGPDQHKFGFYALTVEREVESWRALGPNGREVLTLIEWLKSDASKPWYEAIDSAAWDAARDAAWDAARDAAWGAARGASWDAARGAAWDAARGAALAIIARDLITAAQFDVLYPPAIARLLPAESLGQWEALKERASS
jgi:hypothetical protein